MQLHWEAVSEPTTAVGFDVRVEEAVRRLKVGCLCMSC